MDFSTSYSYDKNGNILTLNRKGSINGSSGYIDELTYTYDGNKLISVNDKDGRANQSYGFVDNGSHFGVTGMSRMEYFYDNNGNLRRDNNKQITDVKYNNLNLPTQIKIYNSQKLNRINYLYDANGTKLVELAENCIDYVENLIFENRQLKYVLLPQGRIAFYDNSPMPEFFIKDHLGSVRMIVDGYIQIIEENSYYPYGMQIKSLSLSQTNNRHKYNGKELISDYGLDWHDYGARNYDAQVARWWAVDPLAEERFWLSPYNYAQNTPFMRIDPDGRLDDWFQNEVTGAIYYNSEMRKGDESQLGENWTHLGENGMFSGGSTVNNDNALLGQYNSLMSMKSKTDGSISSEGAMKPAVAKKIMSNQGYEFNPTQQTIYEKTSDLAVSGIGGGYTFKFSLGKVVEITEKSRYMKNDFKKIGKIQISSILHGKLIFATETVARYEITYTDKWYVKGAESIVSLARKMSGEHDYRNKKMYNNWKQYPNNINLLNDFKKRF